MERIKELLTRRVAGIPVLVFVLIGAAVLLFFALRMKPAPDESGDMATDAGEDELAGDGSDTSQPVFGATPSIYQPSGAIGGPGIASTPQADTNDLWGRRVREWLVAQGASVTMASAVVSKYLSGATLSPEETEWRDKAIHQFGFPPEEVEYTEPTPDPEDPEEPPYEIPEDPENPDPNPEPDPDPEPPPTTPPPTTPPPTTPPPSNPPTNPGGYNGPATRQGKPPLTHKVKGKNDDTTRELALLYYGSNDAAHVNKLDAANNTKTFPAKVGDPVWIPEWVEPKYFVATAACRQRADVAKKNGTTVAKLEELNPNMQWPAKIGHRIRVR